MKNKNTVKHIKMILFLSVDVESYKKYMVDRIDLLVNRRVDYSDDIFISIESIELFNNKGIQI